MRKGAAALCAAAAVAAAAGAAAGVAATGGVALPVSHIGDLPKTGGALGGAVAAGKPAGRLAEPLRRPLRALVAMKQAASSMAIVRNDLEGAGTAALMQQEARRCSRCAFGLSWAKLFCPPTTNSFTLVRGACHPT